MGFIDTLKDIGKTFMATSILGIILWMMIKRLPNHNVMEGYNMYFNLLIILAILQIFHIFYTWVTPYINIYEDAYQQKVVSDNKDFLYYWWDWMYPGYGNKGIELDVYMFILYVIIVIVLILIVIIRLTNESELNVENFENPLGLGICFLETHGYSIFLYGNIFMFLYISRFIMKGLSVLSGDKIKTCQGDNIQSCFRKNKIDSYPKLKECNDNLQKMVCKKDEKHPKLKLEGCDKLEDGHLKYTYDNGKLKIIVNEKSKLQLDPEEHTSELGDTCKKSINKLLDGIGKPDGWDNNNFNTLCNGNDEYAHTHRSHALRFDKDLGVQPPIIYVRSCENILNEGDPDNFANVPGGIQNYEVGSTTRQDIINQLNKCAEADGSGCSKCFACDGEDECHICEPYIKPEDYDGRRICTNQVKKCNLTDSEKEDLTLVYKYGNTPGLLGSPNGQPQEKAITDEAPKGFVSLPDNEFEGSTLGYLVT